MVPRFFAPDAASSEVVALPADEARHLTRVLRIGAGELVTIFDGRGREFTARVETVGRRGVSVRVVAETAPAPESAVTVTLAQAVLKADKMDAVVRDATMLGVTALQPLVTSRTNVSAAALRHAATVDRWRRIAIASAKQCGRAVVPDVRRPLAFGELLGGDRSALRLMFIEPSAREGETVQVASLREDPVPASCTVAVGPEGGWTPDEVAEAVRQGFRPLTLGRRTLRADAAPLAVLAVLQFVWGEL